MRLCASFLHLTFSLLVVGEEESEEKGEEWKKRGQDHPDWDIILNRAATSLLVIVDGYNIIYKWPQLKKNMVKGDLQRA
jgi:YacP-like NYN domain